MASPFERLPQELLDQITDNLQQSLDALARLSRCSRFLHWYIEPLIWKRKDVRHRAMRWGCKAGSIEAIRLAVSYGASVNYIEAPGHDEHNLNSTDSQRGQLTSPLSIGDSAHTGTLTLYLAIKHKRLEAVRCLLELGAQIAHVPELDRRTCKEQSRLLVRRVCGSAKSQSDLARLFFEARLDLQIQHIGHDSGHYTKLLLQLIQGGADPGLVRICLERGADPNEVQFSSIPKYWCGPIVPLSVAVLAGSIDTFNLLLAFGGRIKGAELGRATRRAFHIPMFAAAYSLATSPLGFTMMRACIANGVDLNQKAEVIDSIRRFNNGGYSAYQHIKPWSLSPVHVFCRSITSWTKDPDPVEGLCLLLENGASVMRTGAERQDPRLEYTRVKGHYGWDSPIERLLSDWSALSLNQSRCRNFVKLLIKHGAVKGDVFFLLKKYTLSVYDSIHSPKFNERRNRFEEPSTLDDAQKTKGYKILADLLIGYAKEQEDYTALDKVLWRYIMALEATDSCLNELSKHVIETLIGAGANIQAAFADDEKDYDPLPPLHAICRHMNQRASNYGDISFRRGRLHDLMYRDLLDLLISKGALPDLRIHGQTAVDYLLHESQGYESPSKAFLQDCANLIRDEDPSELIEYIPGKGWTYKGEDQQSDCSMM